MITLILGRQGSGKTLLMAKLAYKAHLAGFKVYSNVKLNFPFHPLDYNDIIQCKLINSYVFIDEVHLLLPSRLSMRPVNISICDNFLSMARKQRTEIFCSTQTLRKMDVRLREEADRLIQVSKYYETHGAWVRAKSYMALPADAVVRINAKVWALDEERPKKVGHFSIDANKCYKLYDTMEIVRVENLPKVIH